MCRWELLIFAIVNLIIVYFRDCTDATIMQAIDKVKKCENLEILVNDVMTINRILSTNKKEVNNVDAERLETSRERNIN